MPLMIINNYLRTIKRLSQMTLALREAEKTSFSLNEVHAFNICLLEGIKFLTRKKSMK